MRWISPRAVLFQPHKAFDPVNPAISRGMRQSATGVRFAGRTLNFPTAKVRISQGNLKSRLRVPVETKLHERLSRACRVAPRPRRALSLPHRCRVAVALTRR